MGYYHVAQICINGHCITAFAEKYREECQPFCDKCGAPTIMTCPECNAMIRGDCDLPDSCLLRHSYSVPSYCYSCGKPFPWTKSALDAMTAIIQDDEDMSAEQKTALVEILPDTISETPKSNLAAIRVKRALKSAGKYTADAIRQFTIDFACELVKKQLGF